jgi:tetratricopeptide (TPR) repeat protein
MKPSRSAMRRQLINIIAFSGLSLALLSSPSFADEASDVSKLLKAGQTVEAMKKVDAALALRPKDAQMRFMKGLILTEQNKQPEAIAVFSKLTDDYPELPEPYNNLAVLYASSGQYDKARIALEMAIRTNPTYGTAHENIGDVYAKLASQAYDKALQLDSANSGAKLKLTLVKNLIGNTTGGANPKKSLPITSAPEVDTKSLQVAVKKIEPESVKAELKPIAKSVAVNNDNEDIQKMVESWASAWSDQNTASYLTHYSKDFLTPNGMSRKAWESERHARIDGKGRINVKIESLKVKIDGNNADAKFRQIYTSDQLKANSRKTLELIKQNGKWLIKQERTGN